jgi:hypothetical protein
VTGYPDSCQGPGGKQLGKLCATTRVMYDDGFDDVAGFPDIHDVGSVILDQPTTGLGFATLAPARTLDPLLAARGRQDVTFPVSGYGISFSALQGAHYVS